MQKQIIHHETKLMEGFRLGQENCFAEVFNRLYPALCFYALKITNDQSAAEDIVDESFIKIWEKRGKFYQFGILKSYLYTTVRNSGINWLKSDKRREAAEKETMLSAIQSEKTKLDLMIQADLYTQLNTALETLPVRNKRIMKLLFIEGKNIRETSMELGLSVSTVKTHKSRGIAHLKEKLFNLFFQL